THTELVAKVRRWLSSVDGEEELRTPAEVIGASAELTKDALRIMASAAPAPVAQSEMVKGLTALGHAPAGHPAPARRHRRRTRRAGDPGHRGVGRARVEE